MVGDGSGAAVGDGGMFDEFSSPRSEAVADSSAFGDSLGVAGSRGLWEATGVAFRVGIDSRVGLDAGTTVCSGPGVLRVMLMGSGSGVGVGTGTSGRCGVDFTNATVGDAAGSGLSSGVGFPLGSVDTTFLAPVGSGVGVGVAFTKAAEGVVAGTAVAFGSGDTTILTTVDSGVALGVEFTKTTGGVVPGIVVAFDSGDTTILSAVDSGFAVGVDVLTFGVETGLSDGAAVIKVLVTADDFGAASTLVPALFLTQSSISGSKRSRSFARAGSRSIAICVLTRPLSLDRLLLKLRISSAVSRSYIPSTIAGTRTVHNVCD